MTSVRKVIHYAPLFYPHLGGAESHVLNLLHHSKNVESVVITNRLKGTPSRERIEDAKVVRMNPKYRKISSKSPTIFRYIGRPINAIFDYWRSKRKREWLANQDFDLLNVHSIYDVDALLRLYSKSGWEHLYNLALRLNDFRWLRKRMVFTEHGLYTTLGRWGPISERLAKDLTSLHKNVICVERKSFETLIKWFNDEKEKRVWLVPNGVRLDKFLMTPPPLGEKLRIGYASRLDKQGINLLEATARILPSNMQIVVAGAGQHEPSRFRDLVSNNKMILLGGIPQKDMPDFFNSIDVLLETHDLDIYGLNILEAMACGRPVIRVKGAYRYPVINGETGYLVEPTAKAVMDKIVEISKNPDIIWKLGQNARTLIEHEFGAEKMCAHIHEIYEEVAAS